MATEKFVLKGKKHVIDKDADSSLDYVVDFDAFLPVGDSIDTITAFAVTGGVSCDSVAPDAGGRTATAWVSGGDITVAGDYSSVTFEMTSNNTPPRIEHKTLYFNIVQK